jgi:hypothetical protein
MANHNSISIHKEMNSKIEKTGRIDMIELTRSHIYNEKNHNSVGNLMDGIGDNLDFNFNLIKFASGLYLRNDSIRELSNKDFIFFIKATIFIY